MAEAGPWDKFAPPERPAGPWDKFAPDDEPGVAEDVAKSAAIGLPKGVMKLAGTAGDLRDLAARGGSALAEQFGYDVSPETISKYARRVPLPLLQGPTSSEIRSTVEKATGPLYEPKTVPGQYAQTVTEMVPAALGGPGGWARRLIQGAVVPGIGSEAAGQFTEGTAAEPYARMIGAVGPQAAALGARGLLVSPRGGAVKPADVALLEREGVRDISAGQKTGSTPLQYLEQSLGDVTGAGTRMTERGKEQFTQAVLRRAGIDAERATPEVIDDAFKRIGNQFDRLAANNTLHPDQAMGPQIRQAVDHYNGNVSPPNRAPVIRGFQEEIAQALGANNGVIPGPAYASLRSRMEAAARSAPAEVADTLRGVKNALDHAMERHLERIGSSDLGAWQQVRREYRNILPIERAVTGGGGAEGLISPSALRAAMVNQSRRGYARGTGDLSRLAKAGENVMKPLPQSGTAPRAYMMSLPASVCAIGGGVMTGNPLLLGGGLLGALGPPIGGRALMSRPVQNFFANPRPFNYAPVINTIPGMAGGGRPTGPTVVGEDGPEVFVPDRPGTVVNNDEVRRYLRATTQDYPKFGPGGIPVNPEAFTAAVGGWPESGNVEDRRPERAAAEAEAARAAAAARTGRRGRAEGAGTRFVEGGYGIPAAIGSLNEGARKAMESAGALQHYGNEYYDPAPVVAQALGAAGAPLVAPAMEGAVLGAGAIRRAAIPQTAKQGLQASSPDELWHGVSKVKLPRPISEMTATHVPTAPLNESTITPEALQGGWLLPAWGDRSRTGSMLTAVGERQLRNPVEMQGGAGFMPANAETGAAWASGKPVIGRLANQTRQLAESGNPVYFPYTAMGERSVDFSHHVSDTLAEMVKAKPLSREASTKFDEMMRTKDANFPELPGWPGLRSPNLQKWLSKASGDARNKFAKKMDTAEAQKLGLPSVAEARAAVTDPQLLNVPTGAAGRSIARLDPEGRVITDPITPHRTYDTQLGGQYVGGLEQSVPKELMYPQMLDAYRQMGYDPFRYDYLMQRGVRGAPIAQRADQQWVDSISQYLEQARRQGQ